MVGIFPSLGRVIRYHCGCLTKSSAPSSASGFDLRVALKGAHHLFSVKQPAKSMGPDAMENNNLDTFYAIFKNN